MVLFALIELEEEGYGAEVIRTIERRTGERPSVGAVGTALDRMEARGLVSSEIGEPTPTRGGRRRKVYRLEPDGVEALRRSYETHRRMSEGLIRELERMARPDGAAGA
jgi:DNA-binding PadR family transcriptional regulator